MYPLDIIQEQEKEDPEPGKGVIQLRQDLQPCTITSSKSRPLPMKRV